MRKTLFFLIICLIGGRIMSAEVDFAPIFSMDTDVSGNRRIRALGPLFESNRAGPDRRMWAIRPLTSFEAEGFDNKTERNVLWPVWAGKSFRDESGWAFLVVTRWQNYDISDPESRYRFHILPFYFQGRSKHGENYLALFPVGGRIYEILGRDEIWFALFPLTVYSSINEVETMSYLWPVFSRTTGGGHDRFRVFPIYGYARLREDYVKRFIMWPIWTSAEYRYAGASGFGYVFFPFYGRLKTENQSSRMIIPPLFRFAKGGDERMIHCPWPFFQYRRGKTDLLYVWPLFGFKKYEHIERRFFLWPIVLSSKKTLDDAEIRRFFLTPFLTSRTRIEPAGEDSEDKIVTERFTKVWPVMSYDRTEDSLDLKIPSLWPFRDFRVIERNYEPLWTLYSRSRQGTVVEDELLWGLFRYRRGGDEGRKISLFPFISVERNTINDSSEWNFLKGLIGYRRIADKRRFRFLYICTFGSKRDSE